MLLRAIKPIFNFYNNVSRYSIITRKFNYGQGGSCQLLLTKRTYIISFETIWEDYCQLKIDEPKDQQTYDLVQDNNNILISDAKLKKDDFNQIIEMVLKVPQDFSIGGTINGSLFKPVKKQQQSQQIDQGDQIQKTKANKKQRRSVLRSPSLKINIIGQDRYFQLNELQVENLQINGKYCSITIDKLTLSKGNINCTQFDTKKLMIADSFNLNASFQTNIKSLMIQGNSNCKIDCPVVTLDTVQGIVNLQSYCIDIKKLYSKNIGSKKNQKEYSKIRTTEIQNLNICQGNVKLELVNPYASEDVVLNQKYKGKIVSQNSTRDFQYRMVIQE